MLDTIEVTTEPATRPDNLPTWNKSDPMPWRRARLARVKTRGEFKGLQPKLREIVVRMVTANDSREGMFVGQAKLGKRFGVSRKTMRLYLAEIVRSGVFTCEHRSRKGIGAGRGRTTNRYQLNPALLSQVTTEGSLGRSLEGSSGSTSKEVRIEAPSERIEAFSSFEHVEDEEQRGFSGESSLTSPTETELMSAYEKPADLTTTPASYTSREEIRALEREVRQRICRPKTPVNVSPIPWS